jgi:hypothetical protein
MKPSKPLIKFVQTHLAGLLGCMNLNHFALTVQFTKLKGATMDITPDFRYLTGLIRIDTEIAMAHWKSGEKEEILECLAHECTHLITAEMSDPLLTRGQCMKQTKTEIHFEERVTEHVSRIALRLYKLERKL